MEVDVKVFSSKITRKSQEDEKNNLYELLKIVPAAPISVNHAQKNGSDFQPRNDKYYEPKKRSKLKVKTVRDIRNEFERDVHSYLPNDLEIQQNILLKKIIDGSSKSENTRKFASTILKCDNPISRSGWEMLMNINPNENIHPVQYVLWNGKRIRVCGSKGGKNKFICRVDSGKHKNEFKYRKSLKRTNKGLLQNSLSVKFKPGPLQLKKYLDDSYQKYHVGNIELIDLPKPGLDIQTTYGCSLDPTITVFLNSLRDIDGTISQKWAEFAVSVVGKVTGSKEVQFDKKCNVTFDLSYKYGQSRILMRRDIDKVMQANLYNPAITERLFAHHETDVMPEVKNIICDMIDCVEISLTQDNMYTGVDDERGVVTDIDSNVVSNNLIKEKPKKKYSELDRLHVTVIKLAENSEDRCTELNTCNKSHCSLGCVCYSLECPLNLRRHCGRIDCMFECKCNFSKYKALDSYDGECPELLPDLYNLGNAVNSKLAKEEQKFRQTVIMTGEKSILLKSQKRNWKASKKYSDFYKNMPLKPGLNENRILTIVDRRLDCENIEPWCMVHNLYKCFCKGKFVNSVIPVLVPHNSNMNKTVELKEKINNESDVKSSDDNKLLNLCEQSEKPTSGRLREHLEKFSYSRIREQIDKPSCALLRQQSERSSYGRVLSKRQSHSSDNDSEHSYYEHYGNHECARVKPYSGRKYSSGYYTNTNLKIWELEKNDRKLRKKLESLTANMDVEDHLNATTETNNASSPIVPNEINMNETELTKPENNENVSTLKFQDTRLKTWLEYAFKQYKKSCSKGGIIGLQAPQANKLALYPWDFILSRYRERKNHFLVSKHRPYRMFMAVDIRHPFFQNCINIDNIRFADLYKYPITVKNLLTNAIDLKDSFCILSGLPYCWELKGAVTKVIETNSDDQSNNDLKEAPKPEESTQSSECSDHNEKTSKETEFETENIEMTVEKNFNVSEISKWFVMTVEDDFNEILFSKRGFFVTYKNILQALRVARVSGKTARLSGLKNVDKNSGTQFGVYAIPNVNEDCVFIGPYESDESLGIETVSSSSLIIKPKRTRGFWITTNKVDNMKVIDNPMSFVPPKGLESSDLVSLNSDTKDLKEKPVPEVDDNTQKVDVNVQSCPPLIKLKPVKPIKIRKSDNMFRVTAESVLKTITPMKLQRVDAHSKPNNNLSLNSNSNIFSSTSTPGPSCLVTYVVENSQTIDMSDVTDASALNEENVFLIPPSEDGPQIKIASVYSQADETSAGNIKDFKLAGNMFVLKPEEINKRLMVNIKSCDNDDLKNDDENIQFKMNETEIDTDIEKFLAKSVISPDNLDVFIISDDDEENTDENKRTEVWIECKNIENFGWIPGRRDSDGKISFKFPGFQFTDFYKEEIAFSKINQVLSRKICMPKNITMEWGITETMSELKSSFPLKCRHLGSDYVLTKRGLRHKRDLLKAIVRNFKTYSRVPRITKIESLKTTDKMDIEDTEEQEEPESTDTGELHVPTTDSS